MPEVLLSHDRSAVIWVGICLVVLAALAGAPLFAILLAAAMLGFLAADIPLAIVAIEVYRIVDHRVLGFRGPSTLWLEDL